MVSAKESGEIESALCSESVAYPGELGRKVVRQRDIVLLKSFLRRRLGIAQCNKAKSLAGGREAVVVDGRDLGADGEGEARLDVLELHVVEHNRLEVALLLRRAVEGRELLRLDCEGERWAARERGVGLKGKGNGSKRASYRST